MPWLTLLLAMVYLWPAKAGETAGADATQQNHTIAAIRIVDQFGRQAPTGERYVGSDIFDVTVGPEENEFTFKPDGNQTVVTWTMSGKNNFISKAVSLVMDCDKMVGGQFEKGLASIKSIVEKK